LIEKLKKDLVTLRQQEHDCLAGVHAAQGAIQYIEHLLSQTGGLSEKEFAEMIAGKGAVIGEIKRVSQ
jgi:hypothetical protein